MTTDPETLALQYQTHVKRVMLTNDKVKNGWINVVRLFQGYVDTHDPRFLQDAIRACNQHSEDMQEWAEAQRSVYEDVEKLWDAVMKKAPPDSGADGGGE